MDDNNNIAPQQQEQGPPKRQRRGGGGADDSDGDAHAAAEGEATTTTSSALAVQPAQQQQEQELRSSSLSSPTLQLTGHKGSIYALQYSPRGSTLVSCSFDTTCLLWNACGSYENYNVLKGHKNAVLDCCWLSDRSNTGGAVDLDEENICGSDQQEQEDTSLRIVTCGADKTVQLWDAWTGQRIRKWQDHMGVVNAVSTMTSYTAGSGNTSGCGNRVVSVGDDGYGYIWDVRQKRPAMSFGGGDINDDASSFPVLAVAATDEQIFTGGIDNMIHCWDMNMMGGSSKKNNSIRKLYSMKGHTDTITSLSIHPRGTHVLSNSMDQTLRSWDIRPFVGSDADEQKNRHSKTFVGHKHNAERGVLKCSWNADGTMVSCGSADRLVHIWDEFSAEELYLLPGHKGCVNAVTFHPRSNNVVASGSSDKHIFVGELS